MHDHIRWALEDAEQALAALRKNHEKGHRMLREETDLCNQGRVMISEIQHSRILLTCALADLRHVLESHRSPKDESLVVSRTHLLTTHHSPLTEENHARVSL